MKDTKLANINEALPSKGNDMELFHFLSAVNYAPACWERYRRLNIKEKIRSFSPRPKAFQLDLNSDPHIHQQAIPEEYPSKDGFENNRQLNVIARGILIHMELLNKSIIMRFVVTLMTW